MASDSPTVLLKYRLAELRAEQKRLEEAIDKDLKYLAEVAGQPQVIVKEIVSELANDKSFRNDLLSAGFNLAGWVASAVLARKGGKAAVIGNILQRLLQRDKEQKDDTDVFSLLSSLFRRKNKE